MAGFGDKFLVYLAANPSATTEELAKLAEVTLDQAYNRLMALSYEKRMISAGKGKNRVWSLPGGAPVALVPEAKPVTIAGIAVTRTGWKPSLSKFEQASLLKRGDKVLIEYPEDWRHTVYAVLERDPSQDGSVLCWDIRNKMYCYIPATTESIAKHQAKVVLVKTERDQVMLQDIS